MRTGLEQLVKDIDNEFAWCIAERLWKLGYRRTEDMRDLSTTVIENNAYYEGSVAYSKGTERSSNPYPETSGRARQYWFDGWDKAFNLFVEEITNG
jgi:ribosome modulation factor